MGEALSKLFIPLHSLPGLYHLPDVCFDPTEDQLDATFGGIVQLFFLAGVYGFILYNASNFVAEGSELLLLIPPIAPVVGSVVLPILGAVPDGAIVLFSGLGDIKTANKQLSVGVGALAGSTIMLLTLPWMLSIAGGRVNIGDDGECAYRRPAGLSHEAASTWKKLDASRPFFKGTGVQPNKDVIRSGALTMLWTSVGYFIIQGSAFAFSKESAAQRVGDEKSYALAGLIVCILSFASYLWHQIRQSGSNKVVQDVADNLRAEAIRDGRLSLIGAFMDFLRKEEEESGSEPHTRSGLLNNDMRKQRFTSILKRFYKRYDANGDGKIDRDELKLLLQDLHVPNDEDHLNHFLAFADRDNSGDVQFEEFVSCMIEVVQGEANARGTDGYGATGSSHAVSWLYSNTVNGHVARRVEEERASGGMQDEGEEEEEDIPEDLADLPPDVQKRRIILRSLKLMGTGTALVLLFSDPMVDVLSEIGDVIGVPAFYISFVLAPLASNASELIAAYEYSVKKTRKTITISMSTLEGAAIMNNTFCLAIFLALVYFRGLEWSFSAETISIIFVEVVVAVFAYQRVQTMVHALLIGSLFPISIILVAFLKSSWVGLD